jgi:hypothetical protein
MWGWPMTQVIGVTYLYLPQEDAWDYGDRDYGDYGDRITVTVHLIQSKVRRWLANGLSVRAASARAYPA